MRLLLVITLLFFSLFGFSQEEDSIYFPQEQLIHPECVDADNKNECLRLAIETNVKDIITIAVEQNSSVKDTISVTVSFEVDDKGKIIQNIANTFVNDSLIRVNYKSELKKITENLPIFRVLHKKPNRFSTRHKINYKYVVLNVKNGNQFPLQLIEQNSQEKYVGGNIIEMPEFPGCNRSVDVNMRLCFNRKIQTHISQNFRYPKKAHKKKIQGKVHILFDIDPNGNVNNLRTRGPHDVLENEAIRIINLLPKMKPGKENGEPIKTPFAIPLNFKLR